jgi:acetoacetyl-CoA synthetase
MRFCAQRTGRTFASYQDFDAWSVRAASFWTLVLEWAGLHLEGALTPVVTDDRCEHALFFPELRLSYVENLLYRPKADAARLALTAVHWDGSVRRWTRGMLRAQVAALSAGLRTQGITSGEHVALIAYNSGATVIAATMRGAQRLGTDRGACIRSRARLCSPPL